MNKRKIFVYSNGMAASNTTAELLKSKLYQSGFSVPDTLSEDVELIVCIGGDGAFLEALRKFDFPDIPFIGVNTGHLGFFQEIDPQQLDEFIFYYKQGRYTLQEMNTVEAVVKHKDGAENQYKGLNEIVIKSADSYMVHLNMSIGGSFIERFSGDGILVATAAGSTAYNYSLRGAIVDPRIKLLQVTPISPMNSTAYRCFTSSILLPSDLPLGIMPDERTKQIRLAVDGQEYFLEDIESITIGTSETMVKLLRFEGYDFWSKVKAKFL